MRIACQILTIYASPAFHTGNSDSLIRRLPTWVTLAFNPQLAVLRAIGNSGYNMPLLVATLVATPCTLIDDAVSCLMTICSSSNSKQCQQQQQQQRLSVACIGGRQRHFHIVVHLRGNILLRVWQHLSTMLSNWSTHCIPQCEAVDCALARRLNPRMNKIQSF